MWNHSVHYYCSGVISAARAQRARVLRSRPACTCVRACSRACVWLTRVNIERHTNKQTNKQDKNNTWTLCMSRISFYHPRCPSSCIRSFRLCQVSASQHHEWVKGLSPSEILRLQAGRACEGVSPLHGCARPLRGRWHRHWGAGHPAAGAGDAPLIGQPPPPSPGGAETGGREPRKLPLSTSHPLSVTICNSPCVLPFRSSQTGRTRREISASWSWGKTQILLPLLDTNQRSRSWTAKAVTGRVQVLAGPNPKICRLKSKSMNLQTIHKTFPALLKMMHPTGQQHQLCVTSHFSVK